MTVPKCPSCGSPDRSKHPAAWENGFQVIGWSWVRVGAQRCPDEWHDDFELPLEKEETR